MGNVSDALRGRRDVPGERAERHRKLYRCAVVGVWHVPLRSWRFVRLMDYREDEYGPLLAANGRLLLSRKVAGRLANFFTMRACACARGKNVLPRIDGRFGAVG